MDQWIFGDQTTFRDRSPKIPRPEHFQGSIPENPWPQGFSGIDPRKSCDQSTCPLDFQGSIPESCLPLEVSGIDPRKSLAGRGPGHFQGSIPENLWLRGLSGIDPSKHHSLWPFQVFFLKDFHSDVCWRLVFTSAQRLPKCTLSHDIKLFFSVFGSCRGGPAW